MVVVWPGVECPAVGLPGYARRPPEVRTASRAVDEAGRVVSGLGSIRSGSESPFGDQVHGEAPQPVPTFVVLPGDRLQPGPAVLLGGAA